MLNTAYQCLVGDLELVGLNRILVFGFVVLLLVGVRL